MHEGPLAIPVLFSLGALHVTQTVVTTWAIMALLGACAWLFTRRLTLRPGAAQAALEGVVTALESAIARQPVGVPGRGEPRRAHSRRAFAHR